MAISLYDATVPSFVQTLGSVGGLLEKAAAHCRDNKIGVAEIVETRLFPDMLPFRFQVQQVAAHSADALAGVKAGQFSPVRRDPNADFAALKALVAETRAALEKVTPAEINAREGTDLLFVAGEHKLPFTAENFLLSFSLPNFYFHATTAYDILRMKGVPVGKRDYLGSPRIKA